MKKAKDYAFVHFSSRESAERALAKSTGIVIDEAEVGRNLLLLISSFARSGCFFRLHFLLLLLLHSVRLLLILLPFVAFKN